MADKEMRSRAIEQMKKARKEGDRVYDNVGSVKKVFELESDGIVRAVATVFRGRVLQAATPQAIAQAVAVLRIRVPALGRALGTILSGLTRSNLTDGVQATAAILRRVRQSKTPLDDAMVISRIVDTRTTKLEHLRARSANSLAGNMNARISRQILVAGREGGRISDLIATVGDGLDQEWWRVNRTVVTEASFAYNQAQSDAIAHLGHREADFRGKLRGRWTELINDLTGEPFDDKVAGDSKALHGQVALPGMPFTMPKDQRVRSEMIGAAWTHPPNRPHDRAVLTPWMPDWGVPGWEYRGGGRVYL